MPPAIDALFPVSVSEDGESEGDEGSSSEFASSSPLAGTGAGGGWEVVHQIASEVFFEIEESETTSSSISFESMVFAVSVETPSPQLTSPGAPAILSGGSDSLLTPDPFQGAHPFMALNGESYLLVEVTDQNFSDIDPWISASDFLGNDLSNIVRLENPPDLKSPGEYLLDYKVTDLRGLTTSINRTVQVNATPPSIILEPGRHGSFTEGGEEIFSFLVKRKNSNYPKADDGPFDIIPRDDLDQVVNVFPYFYSTFYDGQQDLTSEVKVINKDLVDYSKLGDFEVTLTVDDFKYRKAYLNDNPATPVSKTVVKKFRIVDNQPPILSVSSGATSDPGDLHRVEGAIGAVFVDPGISILDNYYSQKEIEENLGYQSGSVESRYSGSEPNMEVAGIYKVEYQGIKDPSNNVAISIDPLGNEVVGISRWVEVFDVTPPELTIYGANPLFVDVNTTNSLFRDPGATAYDNLDKEISWESGKITVSIETFDENGTAVPVESTIDEIVALAKTQKSLNKTYQMVYSYIDAAGNQGTTSRQIVLINSPYDTPFIVDSSPDDNPLVVDVLVISDPSTGLRRDPNTNRFEPGVTAYKDFGGNLEPQNLTSLVTENEYIGGELGAINDTTVNFSLSKNSFVDPQGNPDENFRSVIRYSVQDEFGNEASYEREVRVVDRHGPVITLKNGSEGTKNFKYVQAGFSFEDPGFEVSDNYDENVSVTSTLIRVSDGENLDFDKIALIGFTEVGSYRIEYSATDRNENAASDNPLSDTVREIEVIDTIKPQMALFTHDYVRGTNPSLSSLNDPSELENVSIIDASNQVPDLIQNSLSSIPGWTGSDFNPDIALTLDTEVDFYVLADQSEILVDGHPNSSIGEKDPDGRWRYRMSAFYIKDGEDVVFEDPGIYVRNDSGVEIDFSAKLTPVYKPTDSEVILSYKVNYYVNQKETGEANQLIAARNIYIIDQEKPLITLEPPTDGIDDFIIVEANRVPTSVDRYTDLHGDNVDITQSGVISPAYLELSAFDVMDGILTSNIVRTVKDEDGNELGQILSNNDQDAVATNIASIIDATELDAKYTIEYFVDDIPIDDSIPPNRSELVTRHLVVKDTKAPTINVNELNSTLLVDFLSTSDPDVSDGRSVATFLLTGLSATDENDFDQNLTVPTNLNPDLANWTLDEDASGAVISATYNSKWKLEFSPSFIPGAIYPEVLNANQGYRVAITVRDQSGNTSSEVIRYLQVGDFTPPTLTLIGKSEIHDFMRFKSNPAVNPVHSNILTLQGYPTGTAGWDGNNSIFLDRPFHSEFNREYNSTGFAGGAHRMLLADYNFVEPGIYAEDQNAYFDIKDNYPDLNGNGIGEGHAIVRVDSREKNERLFRRSRENSYLQFL